MIDNPDAEPVMHFAAASPAIIVYGKHIGTKLTVYTDNHCPVHDPMTHKQPPKQQPTPP